MIQIIGFDGGRGYGKAYSEYQGKSYECMFKSVAGIVSNRVEQYPNYIEDNIHICVDDESEYFVGELAEKESEIPMMNSSDDKTTLVVEVLLYTALLKIAQTNKVKIVIGVPNVVYNQRTLEKIKKKYKNKKVKIEDKITSAVKTITIEDVAITKEADSALVYHVRNIDELTKPIGLVSVGFKTTEVCYYDKEFNNIKRLSKSWDKGNNTALKHVQSRLQDLETPIKKELYEIDSSDEYSRLKREGYNVLMNALYQDIETLWINQDEMDIVFAGGTPYHFEGLDYELIEDSQMATAKGLFLNGRDYVSWE